MTESTKSGGTGRRRLLWGVAGAAALVLLVLALLPDPVPVDLAEATRGSLRLIVEEDGVTRVRDRYVVAAPLAGTVSRIQLRPGDRVKAGQEVARITPLPSPLLDARSRSEAEGRLAGARAGVERAAAEVERATAALEAAERETGRQRVLLQEISGSTFAVEQAAAAERARRGELEAARSGARIAASEEATARAALSRITGGSTESLPVSSPVEGVVLRVQQESEGAVQPGAPLLEVGDPGRLEVVVDLLTTDAVQVSPGAPVTLQRWGGEPLTGQVRRVEPSAFTRLSSLGVEEQRVNVLIDPLGEGWEALGDGFRVESQILVLETPEVTRVPASAVFRSGDGWAIFRVDQGRARLMEVEVGERTPELVEVRAGLEPGDRVVIYPGDLVKDGVRVEAR
jgi:HlyD family secretion protein